MRRKLVGLVFAAVMLFAFSAVSVASPISDGDLVYLTRGTVGTNGGPFTVNKVGELGLFDTFCLERNETVKTGSTNLYSATIGIAAINGGLTGGPSDELDDQTAFLYSRFTSGFISNTNALQVAIWQLEGEAFGVGSYGTDWNTFWTAYGVEAQAMIDMADTAVAKGWTNGGFIKVLNLWDKDANGNYKVAKQSQLINVPEPLSMILLGFGLLGVGAIRKIKK